MEILSSKISDIGTAVWYLHRLDPLHDVSVLDLHGLVLPELVQDGLGHLLGGPVLGAQRLVVQRHRPGHLLVAAVPHETPYRGHGPAALHPALGHLEDRLHYSQGLQVPDHPVGRFKVWISTLN